MAQPPAPAHPLRPGRGPGSEAAPAAARVPPSDFGEAEEDRAGEQGYWDMVKGGGRRRWSRVNGDRNREWAEAAGQRRVPQISETVDVWDRATTGHRGGRDRAEGSGPGAEGRERSASPDPLNPLSSELAGPIARSAAPRLKLRGLSGPAQAGGGGVQEAGDGLGYGWSGTSDKSVESPSRGPHSLTVLDLATPAYRTVASCTSTTSPIVDPVPSSASSMALGKPSPHNSPLSSPLPSNVPLQPAQSPSSDASAPSINDCLPPPNQALLTARPAPPPSSGPASEAAFENLNPMSGRPLRRRTLAQLQPYAYDQAKYTKALVSNQWEDAVVRLPKVKPAHEPARGKGPGAEKGKGSEDDLGGWLEIEGRSRAQAWQGMSSEGSDGDPSSSEGLREDEIGRLPGRPAKRPRISGPTKHNQPRERSPVRFDEVDVLSDASHRSTGIEKPRDLNQKAKSARRKAPGLHGVTVYGGGGLHDGSPSGPPSQRDAGRPKQRALEEDDDDDDELPDAWQGQSGAGSGPANPSAPAERGRRQHLGRAGFREPRPNPQTTSTAPSSAGSSPSRIEPYEGAQSSASSDVEVVARSPPARTHRLARRREASVDGAAGAMRIVGKRKKALKSMMPGVFMKRAQEDLELMELEKEQGAWEGSDWGSGDDDDDAGDGGSPDSSDAGLGMPRARVRQVSRDWNEPPRLAHLLQDDPSSESEEPAQELEEEEEDTLVADWLALMGPRRRRMGADAVERYLTRAPGRSRAQKKPRPSDGTTRPRAEEPSAARAPAGEHPRGPKPSKKQGKETRSGEVRQTKIGDHFAKAVSLCDDHALWGTVEASNAAPALGLAPPAARALGTALAHDVANARSFTAFKDFTPDFAIRRLVPGVAFPPFSYTANGFLRELVELRPAGAVGAPPRSCTAFDTPLDTGMGPSAVVDLLPAMNDRLQDELNAWLALDPARSEEAIKDAATYLRFLGQYVSQHGLCDGAAPPPAAECVVEAAGSSMKGLLEQLQDLAVDRVNRPDFSRMMLAVAWGVFELALRLFLRPCVSHGDGPAKATKLVGRALHNLVRRLLEHGLDHTVKRMRPFMDPACTARELDDLSCEIWAALISVAVAGDDDTRPPCLRGGGFWAVVFERTKKHTKQVNMPPVAAGEAMAYQTMALCALSQFSVEGYTRAAPQLAPFWEAISFSLDPIQPEQLSKASDATAEWRRDRYIWCLAARVLVMNQTWGWRLELDGGVVQKLYTLLNARRLERLSTEQSADFLPMLADPRSAPDLALASGDPAFVVFAKVLFQACYDFRRPDAKEQGRAIARELMKMSPIRQLSFPADAPASARARSSLVNHYNLFLAYMLLCPPSAGQQMAKLKSLCKFDVADDAARKTYLGMLLKAAYVRQAIGLDQKPVVELFAACAQLLRKECLDLNKAKQQHQRAPPRAGGNPAAARPPHPAAQEEAAESAARKGALESAARRFNARILELSAVLRSVQHIMKLETTIEDGPQRPPYPDLHFLHRTWTSDLMESPISLDHLVGQEILNLFKTFLERRDRAVAPAASRPREESQDEYGDFDMDLYNDPALDVVLGEVGADAPAPPDPSAGMDRAFAEAVRANYSGAFYRILSNLFSTGSGSGGAGACVLQTKLSFAHQVVDCWVRCAGIAVHHKLRDWSAYALFGDECWVRITDPTGRREVGMAFLCRTLELDPSTYAIIGPAVKDLWWEAIVAEDLTIQHVLTSHLLSFERDSPVYGGVAPAAADGSVRLTRDELAANRVQILRHIFANMSRELSSAPPGGPSPHLQAVAAMAKAMHEQHRGAGGPLAYARFCREVAAALRAAAGSRLNAATVPALRMIAALLAQPGAPTADPPADR